MTEFETVFEVASTPAEAWDSLVRLRSERADPTTDPHQWWLPGFESTGSEIDSEPQQRLTVHKDELPCVGTVIAITFEHVATGTRIRVVQSGFDEDFVQAAGEFFWITSEHIAADLRLFFETGVLGGRHNRPWTPLGFAVKATPAGLEVTSIAEGSWADRVGLVNGDVLLILAGAPLIATRDLLTVHRVVAFGDELSVSWARDGQRIEAVSPV